MHQELDPGLGFSLEYECSVTQSPKGYYFYVKGGTVGQFCEPSRAEPRCKVESGDPRVMSKGTIPMFPSVSLFLVSRFDSFLSLDCLTVICLKRT